MLVLWIPRMVWQLCAAIDLNCVITKDNSTMNTQYWSYFRGFLMVLGVVFWWVDANAQFSFNRVEGDQGWLLEMPLDTATNGKNHEFDLGPIVKATAPFMKISFPSISPSQLPSLALEEINVKGGGFDILNGSTIPIPLNHTALGAN